MGNLLRLLSRDPDELSMRWLHHSSSGGPNGNMDLFVDFENAQPTESEMEVHSRVAEMLLEAREILNEIRQYKGAGNWIRDALANSTNDEAQQNANEALIPLLSKTKRMYEFARDDIATLVPDMLRVLCSPEMSARQHLECQQALIKQLAELIDFVLEWDDAKMANGSMVNDLSYYKRNRSKTRGQSHPVEAATGITEELAGRMSLFYVHHTPMLKALSDSVTAFVNGSKTDLTIENATELLCTMARVCQRMVADHALCSRFQREDTRMFVLRVLIGLIILVDHVHPYGAFQKSSQLDVRAAIKVVKEEEIVATRDGLLNALRFTTKHLNDKDTPKQIRTMLEV